jgi:hypothetical protein
VVRATFASFIKNRLGFQIAYSSLYGERWRLTYHKGNAVTDRRPAGSAGVDD